MKKQILTILSKIKEKLYNPMNYLFCSKYSFVRWLSLFFAYIITFIDFLEPKSCLFKDLEKKIMDD